MSESPHLALSCLSPHGNKRCGFVLWTTQNHFTKQQHYSKDNNHSMSYALQKKFPYVISCTSSSSYHLTAYTPLQSHLNVYFCCILPYASQIKCEYNHSFRIPTLYQMYNNGNLPHFIHTNTQT
jgi:hypothetical protein